MRSKRIIALILSVLMTVALFSTATLSASAQTVKKTVKLLCIGDSLTDGDNPASYRKYLYRELANDGLDIQFVGPRISTDPDIPAGSGHAGYAGFTLSPDYMFSVTSMLDADHILERDFDMVIIMLGRNDAAYGYLSDFYKNYVYFLNRVYAANPNAIVYCASVPKLRHWMADTYDWNQYDPAIAVHDEIKRLVAQFRSNGKNVNFVDMDPEVSGLTPYDFTDQAKSDGSGQCVDATHPLQSGYEKFGINFYNHIKDTVAYINSTGELPAPPEAVVDDGSNGTATFEEYFSNLNKWNLNHSSDAASWAIPQIDGGRLRFAFVGSASVSTKSDYTFPKAYQAEFVCRSEGNETNLNMGAKAYFDICDYRVLLSEGNNNLTISFKKGSSTLASVKYDDLSSVLGKDVKIKLRVAESGNITLTANVNDIEKSAEAFDDRMNNTGKMYLGVLDNSRIVKFDDLIVNSVSGEEIIEIPDKFVIRDESTYQSSWSGDIKSKSYFETVFTDNYDLNFKFAVEKWANPSQTGAFASVSIDNFVLRIERTVDDGTSGGKAVDNITLKYKNALVASSVTSDIPDTASYRLLNKNGKVTVYRNDSELFSKTVSGYQSANFGTVKFEYRDSYRILRLSNIMLEALSNFDGEVTPDPDQYQPKTVSIVKTGDSTPGNVYKLPDGVTVYKGDTVKIGDIYNITVPGVGTGNIINASPTTGWDGFFQAGNGVGYVCNKTGSVTLYVIGLWTGSTTVECSMPLITFTVYDEPEGGNSGNDNQPSADQTAANDAIAKINAIGTVTLSSESAINTARSAYNALTSSQKSLVSNYGTLTSAESKLAELKSAAEKQAADQTAANSVISKINAIGTVTLSSESAINTARSAYNALTSSQKALVSNYGTLTSAESKLAELKAAAEQTEYEPKTVRLVATGEYSNGIPLFKLPDGVQLYVGDKVIVPNTRTNITCSQHSGASVVLGAISDGYYAYQQGAQQFLAGNAYTCNKAGNITLRCVGLNCTSTYHSAGNGSNTPIITFTVKEAPVVEKEYEPKTVKLIATGEYSNGIPLFKLPDGVQLYVGDKVIVPSTKTNITCSEHPNASVIMGAISDGNYAYQQGAQQFLAGNAYTCNKAGTVTLRCVGLNCTSTYHSAGNGSNTPIITFTVNPAP